MSKYIYQLYRGKNLLICTLILFSAIINVLYIFVGAILLQNLVDLTLQSGFFASAYANFKMAAIFILLGVTNVFLGYIKDAVFAQTNLRIRTSVFQHILKSPFSSKKNIAEYYSLIDSDIKLTTSFYENLNIAVFNIATSIGAICFVYSLSIHIGIALTVIGIIIVIHNKLISPKYTFIQREVQADISELKHETMQQYKSYVDCKFYNFNLLKLKYIKAYNDYIEGNLNKAKINIITSVFGYLIGFLQTYIPLFLVPIYMKSWSLGDVLALLTNITSFMLVFRSIGNMFVKVGESAAGAERVYALVYHSNTHKLYITDELNIQSNFILSFSEMSYNYGDEKVLGIDKDSIIIRKNIGIVGRKGSGKSTFLNILSGLLNDYKGSIKINGYEWSEISQEDKAEYFAYMPQNYPIFDLSIFENFQIVAPDKKMEDYWTCLEMVDMDNEVRHMPHGLDTIINANSISAGQRQRLAFCMVLLRDTPIVLMDEPVSNLDADNIKLMKSVIRNYPNKIFIIVSHDKDIFDSDFQILNFSNGGISSVNLE